uniref:Uncharacterized protein n=1 Tax=Heterorhabditis bacteriophora TaxID=37862 RepID=A0A1I7WPY5_HETBA
MFSKDWFMLFSLMNGGSSVYSPLDPKYSIHIKAILRCFVYHSSKTVKEASF